MHDAQRDMKDAPDFNRRDLLLGLGAAATMAYAASATAAMPGHDHSQHAAQQPGALAAANACIDKGQRCISHCLVSWTEGDLELADCARKVNEMLAICDGFSRLLTANSTHVKAYAPICRAVCEECADECRKHDQHVECRECGEACEALVKAVDEFFG